MKRKCIPIAFLLGLLFSAAGFGQSSEARWNSLTSLNDGARLVVDVDGQGALSVKFLGIDDRALIVKRAGKRVELPRNEIAAIHLGKRSSRIKRGLIGALAGAGAGVVIGVVAITAAKADPLTAAGAFMIGIPVGAGIGLATGGKIRKGDLIYSR